MLFRVLVLFAFASSPTLKRMARSDSVSCRSQMRCPGGVCVTFNTKCSVEPNKTDHLRIQENRSKRQTAQTQCILPPQPDQGKYVILNVPNASPGQSFESFILTVSCRRGFGFKDSTDGTDEIVTQQVYCINGGWSHTEMPRCVRFCKLEPHASVRYMCHVPDTGFKACKKYVPPGTAVNPICNGPIYTSSESLPFMTCKSGYWDYIARCKAECGQVTPFGQQLVIGGTVAKRGELPWHVGVYAKTAQSHKQICSGSLVSNNFILSAAHCFWDDLRGKLPSSMFAVAVGKLHRLWDFTMDTDVQKSDVKEINMPVLFAGGSANFQEDIAALILTTSFVYKTFVRPVCLNFNINFDRRQLQQGKSGKIAGWGLTAANGNPSPVLKVVDMPYIHLETCISRIPASFREYITGDKFCAGYTNGTALCRGDSGGGLAFAAFTDLDIERYYLRGVVSAAPSTDDSCNANTYTTFTRITKHEEFIKESLARASMSCPTFLFQCNDGTCVEQGADCDGKPDCADGSDESEELCALGPIATQGPTTFDVLSKLPCTLPPYPDHGTYVVSGMPDARPGQSLLTFKLTVSCDSGYNMLNPNADGGNDIQIIECPNRGLYHRIPKCVRCGLTPLSQPLATGYRTAKLGELPWHVDVYESTRDVILHRCSGSIISHNVVISAAHCFGRKRPFSPVGWSVAAGKETASWNSDKDVEAQKSDVKDIMVPSVYPSGASYEGDIAVVILATPFVFTPSVAPVCIDLDLNSDTQSMEQGDLFRVAAWGLTSRDKGPLKSLTAVDLSYVDLDTCIKSLPPALASYNSADKICSGYTKDRHVFRSLAGSGLVALSNSSGLRQFYLRGLTSYVVDCNKQCVHTNDSYFMFTKVSDYKAVIKEFI